MDKIEATVNQRFPHSAEQVYESWLQPDSIRLWMHSALVAMGLPGELVVIEVDARVGGKFCFSDKRPMGEVFHWGTYKHLDFPNRIAFTWNAGMSRLATDDDLSLVTISIAPNATGCEVSLVHAMDAQWKDYLQRTENGWKNMLLHIERLLAG